MKILTYRITFLISQILLFIFGVFSTIYTIYSLQTIEGNSENFLIDFASFLIGLIFVGSEIHMIIKSFKKGTSFINQICFRRDSKKLNLVTIIINNILLLIAASVFIWFLLCAIGINSIYPQNFYQCDFYFLIFVALVFLINNIYIDLYIILFYKNPFNTLN